MVDFQIKVKIKTIFTIHCDTVWKNGLNFACTFI